jgi:hypothetical protein
LPSAIDEEGIVSVISVPQAFNEEELYVDLRSIFAHPLFLKCEGFNFAGSIKLKAATEMVEAADRDGVLTPHSILVESSSGNLGVALSMIAASKGYRFLCVTDSRCNLSTRLLMEALGSEVHVVSDPDAAGGFLGASAESLITVTLDGSHGSGRDQRTSTSPILGKRSFPAESTLNRALAVNRIACRRSLRDRNRGGPIFGPFRSLFREAKKFR